jgi:hypothetical protein
MTSTNLSHGLENPICSCDSIISYVELSSTVKHGITGSADRRASEQFILVVAREAQNFPAVHRMFMAVVTKRSHSSPPWATYIQSTTPPPQPHPRLCHPPIHALVLLVEMMASVCAKEDYDKEAVVWWEWLSMCGQYQPCSWKYGLSVKRWLLFRKSEMKTDLCAQTNKMDFLTSFSHLWHKVYEVYM